MPNPDKPDYTHGSTGQKPSQSRDYENGDRLDADNLDYFINTHLEKIKAIIDALVDIDSDGDGVVDRADSAVTADSADAYKGNDIDSDGDGKVNSAELADSATSAVDATNVTSTYKGNDIDSDGDGKVDDANNADYATNAGDADTVDGNEATELIEASVTDDGSDITTYSQGGVDNSLTIINTSGSGVLTGGIIYTNDNGAQHNESAFEITVDGGTTFSIPYVLHNVNGGGDNYIATLPTVKFETSLKVDVLRANESSVQAHVIQ